MATRRDGLAVCLTLCIISLVSSSDISFTSSPARIHPLDTEELTLRCSLKESAASVVVGKRHLVHDVTSDDVIGGTAGDDVSFVQSIVLTKSGVDVATVTGQFGAKVFDNATDVKVSGQVPGTGDEKGYLQISWEHPGPSQAGTYQCAITGTAPSGHVQSFVQTVDVFENEASLNDIIAYVQKLKITNNKQAMDIDALNSTNSALNVQINDLKTSNDDLNVQVKDLKTSNNDLNVQVNDLKTSNNDLNVQVNYLKTSDAGNKAKISQNTATITELKKKFDTHVIFSMWLQNDTSVQHHDTVVFNMQYANIGGGYDSSTGEFTAPFSGTYNFIVNIAGQKDEDTYVCLTLDNGKHCWGKAYTDKQNGWQSATLNSILWLSQGDKVKVISMYTSELQGGSFTSFSGHLLALT